MDQLDSIAKNKMIRYIIEQMTSWFGFNSLYVGTIGDRAICVGRRAELSRSYMGSIFFHFFFALANTYSATISQRL